MLLLRNAGMANCFSYSIIVQCRQGRRRGKVSKVQTYDAHIQVRDYPSLSPPLSVGSTTDIMESVNDHGTLEIIKYLQLINS